MKSKNTTLLNKKNHNQSKISRLVRKYPQTIKLIIGLLTSLIILSFIIGWPQFAFAYARCGFRLPIMAQPGSTFAGGTGIPYYYQSNDGSQYSLDITKSYYCSTQEAEANGVEPSPSSNAFREFDRQRSKN